MKRKTALLLECLHPGGVFGQTLVALGLILALREDVDLDLRLGAGGTHEDRGAVSKRKAQHVGAGELDGAALTACAVEICETTTRSAPLITNVPRSVMSGMSPI